MAEKEIRPAASRARDDVLSFVSHDLRSPLMGIMLAAETLLRMIEGADRARERTQLERIRHSAHEMRRMIDDLLDAADLDAGRMSLAPDIQDVGRMFDEMGAKLGGAAADSGVTLRFQRPDGRLDVRCDRGRVVQVLSALIGNSIEFTPVGGTVTVTAQVAEGKAVLTVTDTGPQLPMAAVARLFERAWPADADARKGRGLGLHVAKGLVEAHGSAIRIDAPAGGGTAFSFTLPLAAGA
jgi:signal transduction histidine kinase